MTSNTNEGESQSGKRKRNLRYIRFLVNSIFLFLGSDLFASSPKVCQNIKRNSAPWTSKIRARHGSPTLPTQVRVFEDGKLSSTQMQTLQRLLKYLCRNRESTAITLPGKMLGTTPRLHSNRRGPFQRGWSIQRSEQW